MDNNASTGQTNKLLLLSSEEEHVRVTPDGLKVIHLKLINNGPDNDMASIEVKGVPAEWISFDESNVLIAAGAIEQIQLTIHPPIYPQSDVGEYNLEIKAVSQYDPWRSDQITIPVTVVEYETEGRIGVLLGAVQYSVMPGSGVTIRSMLKNRGISDDVFVFGVEGIPENWVTTVSPQVKINAGQNKPFEFSIHAPRSSDVQAGRIPFKIVFTSLNYATEYVTVSCILTIAAFTDFSSRIEPEIVQANEPGKVIIRNEGNNSDVYTLMFHGYNDDLVFERIRRVPKKGSKPDDPNPQLQTVYNQIISGESLKVDMGKSGALTFRAKPKTREFIGGMTTHPFTTKIQSSSKVVAEVNGQVRSKGIIPPWVIIVALVAILIGAFLAFSPDGEELDNIAATKTASAILTPVEPIEPTEEPIVPTESEPEPTEPPVEQPTDPVEPTPDDGNGGIELPEICSSLGIVGGMGAVAMVYSIGKRKREV